jgi:hypothetical protein
MAGRAASILFEVEDAKPDRAGATVTPVVLWNLVFADPFVALFQKPRSSFVNPGFERSSPFLTEVLAPCQSLQPPEDSFLLVG